MQRGEDYPEGSRFMPGAFPSSSSSHTFPPYLTQQQYDQLPITHYWHTPFSRPSGQTYYTPRDDIMEIDSPFRFSPTTPPRSLTHQRGVKRAAEDAAEELLQAQRLLNPQQPSTRRVAGMFTTIPHQIWAIGSNAFTGFYNFFRPAQVHTQAQTQAQSEDTYINALETDESGRKRRAIDVTPFGTPSQPRDLDGDSEPMFAPEYNAREEEREKARQAERERKRQEENDHVYSPWSRSRAEREIARRAQWHKEYFGSQNVDRLRLRPQKPVASTAQTSTHDKTIPLRDRQVSALVAKAHRAQGGSFAQKAAAIKAQREALEKAEREQLAAEKAEKEAAEAEAARIEAARIEAEKEAVRIEAARLEAEEEEARKRAEEEAARAQDIITEVPQAINTMLQNSMNNTVDDRHTMVQLGSIPLQKLTFKRILASDRGTENWLDDDAVNAWFNSIGEAKKRQTNYVKSDTNPPPFANLQTAWYDKQKKDGIPSLKRWMKRSGVGGANILKCERLFLPINMGSHWTLLIINGTQKTIEYLDSLGGDGTRFFKLARELLQAELGNKYDATKWKDSKRDRSSKQDNGSDCGVFTCFNGLAAAKDLAYKDVTAKKMPAARRMMAGVLINGGFEGDFDL